MDRSDEIYLVDDDPAIRDSMGLFLESEGYRVLQIATATDLLDAVNDKDRVVVVLDQYLDDMSGLEVQAKLNALGIDWPLIFITGSGNIALSVKAMKAGAVDFLEKPVRNEDLLTSVERAFTKIDKIHEASRRRELAQEKYRTLSKREREVMEQIVSGQSNSRIAAYLGLSVRTIEVHRANINRKLGVHTLADLVRLADLCPVTGPDCRTAQDP